MVLDELSRVARDIIKLSEFRVTGAAYTVLPNGPILCYTGLPDKQGAWFLIHMKKGATSLHFIALLNE